MVSTRQVDHLRSARSPRPCRLPRWPSRRNRADLERANEDIDRTGQSCREIECCRLDVVEIHEVEIVRWRPCTGWIRRIDTRPDPTKRRLVLDQLIASRRQFETAAYTASDLIGCARFRQSSNECQKLAHVGREIGMRFVMLESLGEWCRCALHHVLEMSISKDVDVVQINRASQNDFTRTATICDNHMLLCRVLAAVIGSHFINLLISADFGRFKRQFDEIGAVNFNGVISGLFATAEPAPHKSSN